MTEPPGSYNLVLLPGNYIVVEERKSTHDQRYPMLGVAGAVSISTAIADELGIGTWGYALEMESGGAHAGNNFGNWPKYADLSITKTDSPTTVALSRSSASSRELDYTIPVTNSGPGVANSVVVTDTLDPDVSTISDLKIDNVVPDASAWSYSPTTRVLTVNLGNMAASTTKTITFQVLVAYNPTDQAYWWNLGGGGAATAPANYATTNDLNNFVSVAASATTPDNDLLDNTYWQPTAVNIGGLLPAIKIVKTTRAYDGVTFGDGVLVHAGSEVLWRYTVQIDPDVLNPAGLSIYGVTVTDDNGTPDDGVEENGDETADDFIATRVSTTGGDTDNVLEPGEIWTYEATGTAVAGTYDEESGDPIGYANVGTATGDNSPATGIQATTDTDDSSYFGSDPAINIDKVTNGDDGLFIHVGDAITWTYTVTNTGNVPLSGVWVDDDMLVANPVLQAKTATTGDPDDDGLLDLDEAWIYTATGVATANDPAWLREHRHRLRHRPGRRRGRGLRRLELHRLGPGDQHRQGDQRRRRPLHPRRRRDHLDLHRDQHRQRAALRRLGRRRHARRQPGAAGQDCNHRRPRR